MNSLFFAGYKRKEHSDVTTLALKREHEVKEYIMPFPPLAYWDFFYFS